MLATRRRSGNFWQLRFFFDRFRQVQAGQRNRRNHSFACAFTPALQPLQDGPRTLHHRAGNPGKSGHFHTVAAVRGAGNQLVQKENVVVVLAYGNVHGKHASDAAFERRKLVIVGGKERAQFAACPLGKVFHHGPGKGHTVVGACATPNLVQNHKASAGSLPQNTGCLHHFDHKGTLTLCKVVRGPHA